MRPRIEVFEKGLLHRLIEEGFEVLEKVGVFVESKEARSLLADAGARTDHAGRFLIGEELARRCLETVPGRIRLFDRNGEQAADLGSDRVHYDPGSAAIAILDHGEQQIRQPGTRDAIDFARLVDRLPEYDAQSTGVVPADLPKELSDRYRLYLALLFGKKPVVTGTFVQDAFPAMKAMLVAVRGGEDELHQRPLAIFDCCPSPPLKWSALTCDDMIAAARAGIPAEMVSMPMAGATSPASLYGAVVQHTAECLSGITIHQLACPSSPIIWGGSPSIFDMRNGTTPMGAVETMMICLGYNQVGKALGLPVHAYMGLSDSRRLDAQAGLESGLGAMLGALGGVNMISGPGMLDFESCQSLEKVVVDHDAVGMARRLIAGIEPLGVGEIASIMSEGVAREQFLSLPSTRSWYAREQFFPKVLDRSAAGDGKTMGDRASAMVRDLLRGDAVPTLDRNRIGVLNEIILAEARKYGLDSLPYLAA